MLHTMKVSIWATSLLAGATAVRGFVLHGRQRVDWSMPREYVVRGRAAHSKHRIMIS